MRTNSIFMECKNKIFFFSILFFCNNAFSQVFNILEYGASGDTSYLSTQAVQAAIDSCSKSGGRQVLIPAGKFKIGTIVLKSNVRIYLEAGALLYGSTKLEDYKNIKTSFISLRTQDSIMQLIYAENCTNIALGGFGEIDGQGAAFVRQENDEGITRPFLIRFIRCTNVTIENLSDTEDDDITLKSTSSWITENVAISNCIVSSRWNAIKMCTESNGGFKNITISNCVLKSTKIFPWNDGITSIPLTGLALMITDGGILENVVVSNIVIDGYKAPIYIRLANRARSFLRGMPVTSVGKVSDISISNVQIANAGKNGCSISGIPGYPVENIRLSNISMTSSGNGTTTDAKRIVPDDIKGYPQADIWNPLPAFGFYVAHAKNISFNAIELHTKHPDKRPVFVFKDVEEVYVANSRIHCQDSSAANIVCNNGGNLLLNNKRSFLYSH